MIKTKCQLKETLRFEEQIYRLLGYKGLIHALVSSCEVGYIFRYIRALRYDEYCTNNNSIYCRLMHRYWRRKHNALGIKLGIAIPVNTFDRGLRIYHSQGIIVHRDARIGKNCCLHGMNCIGNNGKESDSNNTPVIGDSCDIGVGASIIGNIRLGNDITIAAGAVVCKSYEDGCYVLKGVPAKGVRC